MSKETVSIRHYNHSPKGYQWDERMGIVIESSKDARGYERFPSIYLADNGQAELSDAGTIREDGEAMAEWLEAAAAAIRERLAR